VPEDVLQPRVVGIADGRHAVGPARILAQALTTPVGDVEGRVRAATGLTAEWRRSPSVY
jgi:hypothetical protein